jgi:hypothetical protein
MGEHERFSGPVQVVSGLREGWGFTCECGYRSPLFETHEEAIKGMGVHRSTPPEDPPKKRRPFGRRIKERWPGWPKDRRHLPF